MEIFVLLIMLAILITVIMGLISIKNNPRLTKRERVNYSFLVTLFPFWGTVIYYFLSAKKRS